ncbi:EAL domain-containing protein, partial [Mycobacterium tuberculosis]|nr:EAL domain-containing protein [Mycobacterium tuberculosis]
RHGAIPPAEFIPLAEETGQISAIGAWVLEQACRAAAAWPAINISVNVSPIQFRYDRLVATVAEVLERTQLPAHRLELEITESVLLDDRDRA